jgi:NAD(P)-dependent dehydrogenase (short-subunit alcohol dehydrogenase family)
MPATLVTGANKGLGCETARRLMALGHTVYLGAPTDARNTGLDDVASVFASGLVSLAVTNDPERIEWSVPLSAHPSSKAAFNMLTSQYAKALPGIRIDTVDPGYTATDRHGAVPW